MASISYKLSYINYQIIYVSRGIIPVMIEANEAGRGNTSMLLLLLVSFLISGPIDDFRSSGSRECQQ